ncbi:MAG TPA: SurA N-terminal domain-containing protein [Pyrinomonadaceae bacterium]|nr:SurA N-terminal domain-containing protein [Pyrinomonadaceae bacterium]
MLKFFSRLERTRGVVIVSFAVLVVLGLVVAGYTRGGGNAAITNPFKSNEALAKVNGDEVTVADFSLLKKKMENDNQLSQFGGMSLAQMGYTDDRILDQAVNARIAAQEAQRLGLAASDEEVRDSITKQFTDPTSGGFDVQRYKDYIVRNYGSVPLYEQNVRDTLAARKLMAFVTAGVQVSEPEIKEKYMRENASFDLTYVAVNADDLSKKLNPSDEELRQYFDAHKTDYRFQFPQKKIRYLFVNQEKAGQKIPVSDDELRKEYDALSPENKMAGVKVQQIVLKVADPKLDQDVLTKASQIVARIRKDDLTASEDDFANAARGNSEDPSTAKTGGWLPSPVKRNPNKKAGGTPGNAADLLQDTLDWKEGQVGDPLKTGNAYYIFRRGPVVPKTFEDAKQEILVSLRNRKAFGAAQAIAQKGEDLLKQTHDVQKVAQQLAPEANMTPAEMVKETPFVQPGDDVPGIGSSPQFEEAIQPLEEPNQVGGRVGVKDGFAVPMLVEKRPERIPDFEEVKDKVAADLKRSRAQDQLEQTARDIAANAGSPDALKAAADKAGLKAEDEEAFKVGRPLGKAGADPALDAAVYALKAGEVSKTPVKVGGQWVVVAAKTRKDADPADFDKQREHLVESALNDQRAQVFDEYLVNARRQLEEKGRIEIYNDTLAKLQESEEPAAQQRPPTRGLPFQLPPQGK